MVKLCTYLIHCIIYIIIIIISTLPVDYLINSKKNELSLHILCIYKHSVYSIHYMHIKLQLYYYFFYYYFVIGIKILI